MPKNEDKLVKDMAQQIYQSIRNESHEGNTSIKGKLNELKRSVSKVYRYELLTTNQYLNQMELVLEIFNELSESLENQ